MGPLASSTRALLSSSTAPGRFVVQHHPLRSFTTSVRTSYRQTRLDPPIPSPTARQPHIPEYPLGERQVYKQANTGLYGRARVRFGNNVSEDHGIRTRRKWRPNVQTKRLWSESLGCFVRTRLTTRVLRTVDKLGGLDAYLLGEKTRRIEDLGPWGWKLRWRIMQTDAVRERFRRERIALGLPAEGREGEAAPAEHAMFDFDIPAELAGQGITREGLMEETQRVIEGEEIDLGSPEDFMHEKPREPSK